MNARLGIDFDVEGNALQRVGRKKARQDDGGAIALTARSRIVLMASSSS